VNIYLEHLRKYRESQCSALNFKAVFPIWGEDTKKLTNTFCDLAFKAITVAINGNCLDKSYVGQKLNKGFL
jgi:diphthamide synthase (EF-2-diphthine--ammonia ligase)